MCDIDVVKLRRVASDFLDTFNSLTDVSTKQVRRHCEAVLDFPENTLTGADEKEILAAIVQNYVLKRQKLVEKPVDVVTRKQRVLPDQYSAYEHKMVLEYARSYLARSDHCFIRHNLILQHL